MKPIIDLEKIDWNSVTNSKSLFESILDALKSSDRKNEEMQKEIKRLAKETEAFSKEREKMAEMDERINLLEDESAQKDDEIEQIREENKQIREESARKDDEIEQKDDEIESLRAENAALLQGQGADEAVMDRIARLEKAVADSNAQLRDARAANSALAAENLGIRSKSKPKGARYESDVKPPNPHGTVTVRRPREDPPVSVHLTADQTRCIHGHLLSDPTETVPRLYEDIVDGSLVGIECRVVRRYCRACRRQISADVPGVVPKERFGVNLMSLEAIMRMYCIPYGIIQSLVNIIYRTSLAKSTVIHHVDIVARSLIPLYEDLLEHVFFSRHIYGDETTWRIAGVLHWLWVLAGDDATVFHADKSRGGDVLEMLIGGYGGHVTSDSHAAWNRVGLTHQKCHFHYLSGIRRTLRMKSPGPEFKKFSQTLKKIILDSWFPERGNNPDDTPAEKRKKIRNLQARVRRLISNAPDEEHCRRFAKRLGREITHLFHVHPPRHRVHQQRLRAVPASQRGGPGSLAWQQDARRRVQARGAIQHPRDVQDARRQPPRFPDTLHAQRNRRHPQGGSRPGCRMTAPERLIPTTP